MKQEKFKIYKTKAGKYYFILFAPNGQALTKSYNYACAQN